MNRGIATALFSVGTAQLAKAPLAFLRTGRWDWSVVTEPGGMPSSHSAGAASLAAYTAMKRGLDSIEFAISAMYGLLVMYDAMGIRRHAGEIAIEVNQLDQRVEELAQSHPGVFHERRHKLLKERIGHVPGEVAAGTLLGAAIGAASYCLELRRSPFCRRLSRRKLW